MTDRTGIDTAITVYLDNDERSILEIGWLCRSWIYSGSNEMSDIIIFYNPSIDKNLLPTEDGIEHVPMIPLTERGYEWTYYPHINGTFYLTAPEAAFITKYRYVLKTDNDVFLTKHFKNLRPRLATFGTSGYSADPSVAHNLIRIAEEWGITLTFIGVGATIMAQSEDVITYAKTQFEYAKRLRAEEFPDGEGEWPGWYLHVLNMYAGCLASNKVFGNSMVLGGLDVWCMSQDPICNTDYHIHAWHTDDHFSKLKWHEGMYENWDMCGIDENKVSDYCLLIAGKRGDV